MAQWRSELGQELGDLAPRLLAIVIAELKRDLSSGEQRNRVMYHAQHGHFWSEKAADFARAAEEVYAEQKQSGAAVKHIADYLYWGLSKHPRAIEILLAAHKDKILDESGQSQLVDYLHQQGRHAESIPILEPLVETRPDNMQYRVWLMHAYFRGGRQEELVRLLQQTDTHFHEEGRWREEPIAALAHSCLENQLFERSVAYYEEVISLHQRTQPNRGIGQGTLSAYYRWLSEAYLGLKKTPKAVDAACGAIVSWGPRLDQRSEALGSLENVLRNCPDLPEYVAQLDRQTAESGQENPIVRKALGTVYLERGEYKLAIAQLTAALELQPNDTETHRQLVECYDKLADGDGAVQQLLRSVRLSCRNVQLYRDLGGRYGKLDRPRTPNAPTRRSSRRCRTKRKAIPCSPKSGRSKAAGRTPSPTGGRWPGSRPWNRRAC